MKSDTVEAAGIIADAITKVSHGDAEPLGFEALIMALVGTIGHGEWNHRNFVDRLPNYSEQLDGIADAICDLASAIREVRKS